METQETRNKNGKPPQLRLSLSPISCFCLVLQYVGGNTKAEIFARIHEVFNIIQNDVSPQAVR